MKNLKTQKEAQEFVMEMLKAGTAPKDYKKYARVQAEQGYEGQEVVTKLQDGTIETTNTVKRGDDGELGWIVTNPDGEQYIVPNNKFVKRYEIETGADGKHAPKGAPIVAIQVKEDVTIVASWGEEQFIKAGGYLNVSNLEDIYGIAEQEFYNTYAPCNKDGIFEDAELRRQFGQNKDDEENA